MDEQHRMARLVRDLQVQIFQDRVEIANPGGLVGGMTLEKLGSVSLPRNPLLFGMMHRMGLVEKIGSGLKRIADMCREQHTPPPNIRADQDWFRIVFQRAETSTGTKPPLDTSGKRRVSVGKTSGMILDTCRETPSVTIPELAELIGVTERSVQRNIQRLQAEGLLRRVGGRKTGHWEVVE